MFFFWMCASLLAALTFSYKAERNISYLLLLFQTVCRLQCLGSCCNISHICLFKPASLCSSWPEKCEARSAVIEVSAAAARSLVFLYFPLFFPRLSPKFNCASAVSAVVRSVRRNRCLNMTLTFKSKNMKMYRPLEFSICSSGFFSSVAHNESICRTDSRHQLSSGGEHQLWRPLLFVKCNKSSVTLYWFLHRKFILHKFPAGEVRLGSNVEHCLLILTASRVNQSKVMLFSFFLSFFFPRRLPWHWF